MCPAQKVLHLQLKISLRLAVYAKLVRVPKCEYIVHGQMAAYVVLTFNNEHDLFY